MPPVVVLQAGDAGRMARLHYDSFDEPWSAVSLHGMLLNPGNLALGLEADGELLAFAAVQSAAGESDLLTIATSPDERRKGYGSYLVECLLRRLGERGITRLTLDVAEDNQPARALYQKLGFIEDGRRPGYYRLGRPEPVDGILMSRTLGIDRIAP